MEAAGEGITVGTYFKETVSGTEVSAVEPVRTIALPFRVTAMRREAPPTSPRMAVNLIPEGLGVRVLRYSIEPLTRLITTAPSASPNVKIPATVHSSLETGADVLREDFSKTKASCQITL